MTDPRGASLRQLAPLEPHSCIEHLRRLSVGRIGLLVDGEIHIRPVNYVADAAGRVVFRTSASSSLAVSAPTAATFEIDELDEPSRTGWSVEVVGTVREITAERTGEAHSARSLPVEPWLGERSLWYLLTPSHITGRRVSILTVVGDDADWFAGVPS